MTGLKNIIRSMKGNRSLYSSLLLQTFLMIYISTISAETYQQPEHLAPSTPLPNKNKVRTYDECKKYLCKYGYLTCDCQSSLNRRKRQLPDGILLVEDNDGRSPNSINNNTNPDPTASVSPKQPCTQQDFTDGLEKFQRIYRLNVTGTCDERTTDWMSRRRCGQPDVVIDKLDTDVEEAELSARDKRSLTDIISKNVELEESILRRKQQLNNYIKEIENESLTPKPAKEKSREKRSQIYMSYDYSAILNKNRISWRLMSDHIYHVIPQKSQRSILKQAFRYWSEVAPLCFYEDADGQDRVDIEIGFLEGVHLSCYRQFDGYGGEIAHKFYRDVHFDNSEPYTADVFSTNSISLLLVAVHELGHVIGLNHSIVETSVMNAIYHQSIRGEFELSDHDKTEVKKLYGPCHGRFDVVFDYVRTRSGTNNIRIFNTFFFRDDHIWRYDNSEKKTRSGDPIAIETDFAGIPDNIDSFLHYFEFDAGSMTFNDEYLFFKGSRYYQYDAVSEMVVGSRLIRDKFSSSCPGGVYVPTNVDATFYDSRRSTRLIYFIKGDQVYTYRYSLSGGTKSCVSVQNIADVFTPSSSAQQNAYTSGFDTIYASNSDKRLYIIKGNDTWVDNSHFNRFFGFSMTYAGKWYDIWQFICDGECS